MDKTEQIALITTATIPMIAEASNLNVSSELPILVAGLSMIKAMPVAIPIIPAIQDTHDRILLIIIVV